MPHEQLVLMRDAQISKCDPERLVELQSVNIDRTRPAHERIEELVRAIGNPYLFRVGDVAVKVSFSPQGKEFADAVASGIMAS